MRRSVGAQKGRETESDLALEARHRLEYIADMQDADLLTAAVVAGVTPDLIRRYV